MCGATFPDHESVAVQVEGPAGPLGVVVTRGQGFRGMESAHTKRSDDRLGTTGNHGIRVPALDHPGGVADGMGPRGAGGHHTAVGPFGPEMDRHLPDALCRRYAARDRIVRRAFRLRRRLLPSAPPARLRKRDVFTEDVIETWIEYKTENEVNPVKLRPVPYEFMLYYDV